MELTEVFKQIVNNAPLEIIIFDKDCRIMYMNKTAQKTYSEILGSKERIVGHNLRSFINEEALSKLNIVIEWFKESVDNKKMFVYHSDEENFDTYITVIRDNDGNFDGFYAYREHRNADKSQCFDFD